VLGLARPGFDQEPVWDAGLERVRRGALDGGSHAFDGRAVGEVGDGNGSGIGNQMPDGFRVLIGLNGADGDDFERGELELAAEVEIDGFGGRGGGAPGAAEESPPHRMGAMMDLNNIAGKPVFVQVKRNATEDDGERDQHPLFARHKRQGLTLTGVEIFEYNGGKAGVGIQRAE